MRYQTRPPSTSTNPSPACRPLFRHATGRIPRAISSRRNCRRLTTDSNPRVPRPAILNVSSLASVIKLVCYNDARQVLHALVAELPFYTQAHGRAVWDGEIAAVHAVGQNGLRVKRIKQINAVHPVVVRVEHDEP